MHNYSDKTRSGQNIECIQMVFLIYMCCHEWLCNQWQSREIFIYKIIQPAERSMADCVSPSDPNM